MNEKDNLLLWNEAVVGLDKDTSPVRAQESLAKFKTMIDSNPLQGVSKMFYNAGILYKRIGENQEALRGFLNCLKKDPHNAIGHFHCGVIYYELGAVVEAAKMFQKTMDVMRQATVIDYYQLGLRSKLFQHETLYNEALCHLKLDSMEKCLEALREADRIATAGSYKSVDIKAAIGQVERLGLRARLELCLVDLANLYTPPKSKLNNIARKDYLGKAKVVSSLDTNDTFSGFSGAQVLEKQKVAKDDLTSQHIKAKLPIIIREKSSGLLPPVRPSSPRPTSPLPPRANAPQNPPPKRPERPNINVEMISGELSEQLSLQPGTKFDEVLKIAGEKFQYSTGTYTLWYLNRAGTYTVIDTENVMTHVWKWKVSNNSLTLYVFGV